MTPSSESNNSIEHVVHHYGDLLFDLCESILWNQSNSQIAFRDILKEIRKTSDVNSYTNYKRAWVLKIACQKLRNLSRVHTSRITPSEQIELDSAVNTSARLAQFSHYFRRLPTDDQILLLLRDKHGLPYSEIASAMNAPEGSVKIQRQQALRTLEEWLWDNEQ